MLTKQNVCRLFVILAREANRAVIFRSGPRLWTQLILWDTQKDTFTEGQWFKGTIYTGRCDISPDGSKMIYFGAKHYKRYGPYAAGQNNWTAISRPPYWTALAMWDTSGTYGGGGYFEDNNRVHANVGTSSQTNVFPDGFKVNPPSAKYEMGVGGNIYYNALLPNRGWIERQADGYWQKDNPAHSYRLFMTLASNDKWSFTLKRLQDNVTFEINSHEWADWDQRGRLIYTDSGRLFVGNIWSDRIESVQLADFIENRLKMIQSPAWARTWDQA
jgi:hypothetical protein